MRTYLVVEGESDKIIYGKWIQHLNNQTIIVYKPEDVVDNSVLLISGRGYPSYFEIIKNAVLDIKQFNVFDQIVVAVDSESFSFEEKHEEIDGYLKSLDIPITYNILIQHFCIETWALGNIKIFSRNVKNRQLKSYCKKFNVARYDPELLPENKEEELNRAQFASKYLNLLLQEKYHRLSYRKNAPHVIAEESFFKQISKRYESKNHIRSFAKFLDYFSN